MDKTLLTHRFSHAPRAFFRFSRLFSKVSQSSWEMDMNARFSPPKCSCSTEASFHLSFPETESHTKKGLQLSHTFESSQMIIFSAESCSMKKCVFVIKGKMVESLSSSLWCWASLVVENTIERLTILWLWQCSLETRNERTTFPWFLEMMVTDRKQARTYCTMDDNCPSQRISLRMTSHSQLEETRDGWPQKRQRRISSFWRHERLVKEMWEATVEAAERHKMRNALGDFLVFPAWRMKKVQEWGTLPPFTEQAILFTHGLLFDRWNECSVRRSRCSQVGLTVANPCVLRTSSSQWQIDLWCRSH